MQRPWGISSWANSSSHPAFRQIECGAFGGKLDVDLDNGCNDSLFFHFGILLVGYSLHGIYASSRKSHYESLTLPTRLEVKPDGLDIYS